MDKSGGKHVLEDPTGSQQCSHRILESEFPSFRASESVFVFLKALLHTASSEFSFCLILAFSEALPCLPIVPAFTWTSNFANCAVRKGLTETPMSGGICAWDVRRVRGESVESRGQMSGEGL